MRRARHVGGRWYLMLALIVGGLLTPLARADGISPRLTQDQGGAAPAATRRADADVPRAEPMPIAPPPPAIPVDVAPAPPQPPPNPDMMLPPALPINLATAMGMAGVNPLDIAAAMAQLKQGIALLVQARALLIPNLNAGVDYLRHDGVFQNIFSGGLYRKDRQSFFVGGGPSLYVAMTDVVYEPKVQRRVVNSRVADIQTARNDVLQSVTQAYFTLQDARGRLVGVDATIVRAKKLVDLAVGLAPALIAPLEINRAKAELQSLRQTREIAVRDWRVASAQLAEILLLDPETLLEPVEPPFVQVALLPTNQTAAELVPIAIQNRPEIAAQRELLAAANFRLKQEKKRPLLPTMIVTSNTTTTGLLAAGNLSAGPNAGLGANAPAFNIDVAAVWQLQNAGVGNIGRIHQRRAEQDLASIEVTRTLFRVRAEVSEALARVQTAQTRVAQTEEGLRQAIESADKNFIGLRETTRPAGELLRLVVRPQEDVAALIALNTAFEQYSSAVNGFNAAQFQLYRALGQPAQWVTDHAAEPPLIPPDPKTGLASGVSSDASTRPASPVSGAARPLPNPPSPNPGQGVGGRSGANTGVDLVSARGTPPAAPVSIAPDTKTSVGTGATYGANTGPDFVHAPVTPPPAPPPVAPDQKMGAGSGAPYGVNTGQGLAAGRARPPVTPASFTPDPKTRVRPGSTYGPNTGPVFISGGRAGADPNSVQR